jgi:hypothetical protein
MKDVFDLAIRVWTWEPLTADDYFHAALETSYWSCGVYLVDVDRVDEVALNSRARDIINRWIAHVITARKEPAGH